MLQLGMFYLVGKFWNFVDHGHFNWLIEGKDLPEDDTDNQQPSVTPAIATFTWLGDDSNKPKMKSFIGSYLCHHRNSHTYYIALYVFCEIVQFLHVIAELFICQWVMNRKFLGLGSEWVKYIFMNRGDQDPLLASFPIYFKCNVSLDFAGQMENYSTSCVLTFNAYNEVNMVIVWFLLVTLSGLSMTQVAYMMLLCTVGPIRRKIFFWKWSRHVHTRYVVSFLKKTTASDQILLDSVFHYVDLDTFVNILRHMEDNLPYDYEEDMYKMRNILRRSSPV
jgi:hypothetical protein